MNVGRDMLCWRMMSPLALRDDLMERCWATQCERTKAEWGSLHA